MSLPRRTNPRSFDHLPRLYDRFAELTGGELREFLVASLPARGGRALDLGCGTGRHATLLADRYAEVLAVDISGPMLAFARQHRARNNITYRQCHLLDVTAECDGVFDLVLSAYTLHHVSDLESALRQLRGLLGAGGQVLLVDVVGDPGLIDEHGHLPRSYFTEEAARGYARDLRAGRPPDEAAEALALKLHPDWLEHQLSDRVLTPARFADVYQAAFPGCRITELYRARAVHYQAPRTAPALTPSG